MGKWIKDVFSDGRVFCSKMIMYETSDYSIFNNLNGNRYIAEINVNKIIRSIKNGGDLKRPITVNSEGEVIEGQHTLEARKRLGLPIYFYIVPKADLKSCISINTSLSNWNMLDYARSYAKDNPEYKKLLDFCLKNNITPGFACNLIHGNCNSGFNVRKNQSSNIKGGSFSATDKEYEIAQKCLDGATELYELLHCRGRMSSTFRRAVFIMMMNDKYDHKKMVKRCKAYKKEFRLMHKVSDILKEFTEVYKTSKEIVHFEDVPNVRAAANRKYDNNIHTSIKTSMEMMKKEGGSI